MNRIKASFIVICMVTLVTMSTSNAYCQNNSPEKEIMIVYVLSASKTLEFHYSINGEKYKEDEIKRDERRDFNAIIKFLKKQYSEGWVLKSSNVGSGTNYEEFYYMLEK